MREGWTNDRGRDEGICGLGGRRGGEVERKEQMKGKRTNVSVWMCEGGDTEHTHTHTSCPLQQSRHLARGGFWVINCSLMIPAERGFWLDYTHRKCVYFMFICTHTHTHTFPAWSSVCHKSWWHDEYLWAFPCFCVFIIYSRMMWWSSNLWLRLLICQINISLPSESFWICAVGREDEKVRPIWAFLQADQ